MPAKRAATKRTSRINKTIGSQRLFLLLAFFFVLILAVFKINGLTIKTQAADPTNVDSQIIETYLSAKYDDAGTVLVSGDPRAEYRPIILEQPKASCPDSDFSSYVSATVYKAPLAVLMYHHIAPVPEDSVLPGLYHNPEIFEDQLRTLKLNCYKGIFVSEIGQYLQGNQRLPAKPIALTFDDGYDDMYANAFPLLKKYGMRGTMYIIVEALGLPGYLTKEQVKEMAESGYVEIASHTLSHANLKSVSDGKSWKEISESKKELEKISGRPVTDLAYPFGYFRQREENYCREAGYLTCASTYQGAVQSLDRRYSLFRLRPGSLTGNDLLSFIDKYISL
ncbi:MAG: polysaccharide deacetylase family protein [Patescibacteria group bacterium]|jgi:peptidoglycan/xylan/chitin deacetylase (PgdA/CDA1 family)